MLITLYILSGVALAIFAFIVWRHVKKYEVISARSPFIFYIILGVVITLYITAGILIL